MKFIFLTIISLIFTRNIIYSQIPGYSGDPMWTTTTLMTDEFNSVYSGTEVCNPNKWHVSLPPYSQSTNANIPGTSYCTSNSSTNISIQSDLSATFLRLALTYTPNTTCAYYDSDNDIYTTSQFDYTAGNIWSAENVLQQYGYYEIKFRIPDSPNTNDDFYGIASNAWLWNSWPDTDPNVGIYSEIDLAEIFCNYDDPNDYNQSQCNIHFDDINDSNPYYTLNNTSGQFSIYGIDNGNTTLSAGWHIISCLWLSNKIYFYIDGTLVNGTESLGTPGLLDLGWVVGPSMGNQFNEQNHTLFSNSLPYYMDIDYIRTYHIDTTYYDCNSVINSCVYDVNTYDGKIKKSISFGGSSGSCASSVNTTNPVRMKATDFIQINGNFTVPAGAEFSAEIYACPAN
ncbi:family 16 glycosylhydrolase [Paracrocinitomix mangrovi]|uniref:glycoside hydrolase family 16 protein n=1 Tax=Paracrocinitomix mangrovi TaxID=2862509 RepID=UPI001C8ED37E|nr:family 16 glycosylhydrolase [Paracrocinitomix mangrovi]UKN01821.1 family 16 glycosylhydrolase [Paracrocinitomix mangrovi]